MTGSKILLDTNIISAWLKGEELVADNIDAMAEVYIPIIVLGELHYGAQYSTYVDKNIESINKIVDRYEVLNTNDETASIYGNVKALLKKKGKPIPENDIWIATIAIQHNLTLITRDKHFDEVDGLTVESW